MSRKNPDKKPRYVITVPATLADVLAEEQEKMRRQTGLHVSISSLVKKAIEKVYLHK